MRTTAAILAMLCTVQAQQAPQPILLPPAAGAFDPTGYYQVRQDQRKCASPFCGGYWIRQVNRKSTTCADGNRQRECYVSEIVTPAGAQQLAIPSLTGSILIKGVHSQHPAYPDLGLFTLERSHTLVSTAGAATPPGRSFFVGIKDTGLRCITTPCSSLVEYFLNTKRSQPLADIQFSDELDAKAVDWARGEIFAGNVVILRGRHTRVTGPAGTATGFKVLQVYMPDEVEPACPKGYTLHKDACRTPYGCAYPEIELTGTGGAPFVDPITGEVTSTTTKSCVASCDPPAFLQSPGQCAVFYP